MLAPVHLLVSCLALRVLVQADYTSIVKVVSYENPTGKSDRDEVCCDYFPPDVETCVSSCHAFYRAFCMKPYQSDLSDCSLGSTTGNFGNNESVIISGVGAWPGSFRLSFEIWDNDTNDGNPDTPDHLIATVSKDIDEDVLVPNPFSPPSPVTVNGKYSTLELTFLVLCNPGFEGEACECCNGCCANEFDCGDGECILSSKKCDGTADCSNALDESQTVCGYGCDPAVLGEPDEEACVACKNTAYLDGVKLQDGSGRVCYSTTSPGSVAAYICENGYSGNHTDVTVCGTNLTWINPKTCVGCDPAVLGVPDEEASVACKNIGYLDGVKLQDGSGRVCYSTTSPGSVAAYICENGYSGNHSDVTVCGTNLTWINPKTCVDTHLAIAIRPPPTSNANLDELSEDGRVATYSCDSALYEPEGSSSIIYDEESGWPDAPTCKVVGWIVFLIILVLLLTIVVVTVVPSLIYTIVLLRKQEVYLTTPKETHEMKENMSYGPLRVQSQPATQEPVYEEADVQQQPVHTQGKNAYDYIRP